MTPFTSAWFPVDLDRARKRLPRTVVLLGLTSLFTDVASEMIFPLLPVFIASLGAGPSYLGLVEGVADATASLLKLATGYVADRVRRRKALVLFGYGIAGVVRPLVAFATAPWHVLAVRVTDRVGKGVRTTPRDVLIADSVPQEETGRAFGFHRAMDHAGAVIGPLVAAACLALGWPMRHVFVVALIPGALSIVALLAVREPAHATATPAAHDAPAAPPRLPASLRSYLAIMLLFSLGNSSDAFLLLRAREVGVPVASIPLLWAAFHVSKLTSARLGGGWSDRMPRTNLIIAGWVIYAGAYLAFGVATQPWHAWATFIVYGIYYGLTEPAEKALVKDLAPPGARGRAYGFYNFIVGVSAIPAGLLTGWLWAEFGPMAALATGAATATACSIALFVWARAARS